MMRKTHQTNTSNISLNELHFTVFDLLMAITFENQGSNQLRKVEFKKFELNT